MTRLLTLTGTGGSGKTHLALAVARSLMATYPEGAWLVELADLREGALVPQAVARVLGLREEPGRTPLEAVIDYLRPRQVLLVLDNCEHLLNACAALAGALLAHCPRVRLLATSREPLGVPGEQVQPVPLFTVPPADAPLVPDESGHYEAVDLFRQRVRDRLPAITLRAEDGPAVAQICRRLDGIPLAIELAAARVGTLSVQEIAARLEDRFTLLTVGYRGAPERQQTLHAAMDWSHRLLSTQEQILLRRLSVFAGGWTLAAAERICTDSAVGAGEMLDLLAGLQAKSLVLAAQTNPPGPESATVRFSMLETVRQYAQGRLREAGEEGALAGAHRDWCLALVEAVPPLEIGGSPTWWLDQLELEHDNLRTALAWTAVQTGGAEALARLAGALLPLWEMRGYLHEGAHWLDTALARREQAPPDARLRLLLAAGHLAAAQGDPQGLAEPVLAEAATLALQTGDRFGLARARDFQAFMAVQAGDAARGVRCQEECLRLMRELEHAHGVAEALHNLAISRFFQAFEAHMRAPQETAAALADALALCTEAVTRYRALDKPMGLAFAQFHHGIVAFFLGKLEWQAGLQDKAMGHIAEAGQAEHECLALHHRVGHQAGVAAGLDSMAVVALASQQPIIAATLFGAADALRERINVLRPGLYQAIYNDQLQTARQALDADAFLAAMAQGRTMAPDQAVTLALSLLPAT